MFGKYFTTNVRVLPHMSSSRLNVSEPLTSDKRQFNYPPVRSISPASTSTKKPTTPQQTTRAVPTTHEVQHNLPRCTTIPATTTQSTSEHIISTTSLSHQQTTTTPQWASTNLHHITQTPSQTDEPDTTTSIPNPSLDHSTTAHPHSTTDYFDSTLTSIPINEAQSSSTTQQPLGLQTLQTTKSLATASQNTTQSFTKILTSTQQPLTLTTAQPTSLAKSTSAKSEEYPETTTVFKTVSTQTKPLTSANLPSQTSTHITPAYETVQATTAQHVISTTSQPKMDSTLNPQQTTTTPQWKPLTSANVPLQTSTQITPAYETSTPTQTTVLSQPEQMISSDTTTTSPATISTDDSTTPRHLTLTFTHTRMGNSPTTGSLSSSLTAPTSSMVDSQPYPNDTKGYISRNITTGDAPRPGGDGSLTSVWHLAANTVLVALAACATITFCCCCSVFAALSWRGRRRRKGRYRTNLRGKRGSMRLIKYVIVRESS